MRRGLRLNNLPALLFALCICVWLAAPARAQSGGNYQIAQAAVTGGGGTTASGALSVTGAIGQGAAGSASGGGYTLNTGFIPTIVSPGSAISGRVTLAASGAGLTSVTVTLTKPDSTTTATTTDAVGSYSFSGLPGGSYSVTPSKTNYSFTPPGMQVTVSGADQTGLDFSASSTATASGAGGAILIGEFRLQGPVPSSSSPGNAQGELDEFIELYNATGSDIDISGYKIDTSAGFTIALPAGATLPARGHYLVANSGGYSLGVYAAPDFTYSGFDLQPGTGLALLDPANKIVDAAGFTTTPAPYKEGGGLASATGPGEYSYFRGLTSGLPADAGDNVADFLFVSTDAGSYGGVQSVLGAPGPEDKASPLNLGSQIKSTLFDPAASSSSSPNRERSSASVTNGAAGTMLLRRTFNNNTGANITKLRFRVVEVTTAPQDANNGTADIRLLDTAPGSTQTSGGGKSWDTMTLEVTAPTQQPNGGGYNSTVVATLPNGGLAPGGSINIQFTLGVQQAGTFRFFIVVEALPGPATGSAAEQQSSPAAVGFDATKGSASAPGLMKGGVVKRKN